MNGENPLRPRETITIRIGLMLTIVCYHYLQFTFTHKSKEFHTLNLALCIIVYLALITDCLMFLICILLWIKGSPKWVNVNAWFSACNHTFFCPDEGDGFNPLKIEVFLQTLLHLAAKSFSHSFSALAKWVSPAKPHTGLPAAGSVLPLLLLTNAACNC